MSGTTQAHKGSGNVAESDGARASLVPAVNDTHRPASTVWGWLAVVVLLAFTAGTYVAYAHADRSAGAEQPASSSL
jgi:hypothetical protein